MTRYIWVAVIMMAFLSAQNAEAGRVGRALLWGGIGATAGYLIGKSSSSNNQSQPPATQTIQGKYITCTEHNLQCFAGPTGDVPPQTFLHQQCPTCTMSQVTVYDQASGPRLLVIQYLGP